MSFTFRQIEIFVEAAVDGNFRKTADRLGISQPAISKQVRALEQYVGKTLFVRTRGSPATLSVDGVALLAQAKDMLDKQQLWHPARQNEAQLHLKVITGDYLLDNLIKPALSEIIRRFPDVSLEFHVTNERDRIFEQIRTRAADLAIFTGNPPPPDFPNSEILSIISCSLYAAPHIASNLGSNLDAIANTPFVLPGVASTKSWVLAALEKAGIKPKTIAARTQFGDVLAEMVYEGTGIGLLFDDHANARFGDQICRIPLEIESAYRVMIVGERARVPKAQPCLNYLRELSFDLN